MVFMMKKSPFSSKKVRKKYGGGKKIRPLIPLSRARWSADHILDFVRPYLYKTIILWAEDRYLTDDNSFDLSVLLPVSS